MILTPPTQVNVAVAMTIPEAEEGADSSAGEAIAELVANVSTLATAFVGMSHEQMSASLEAAGATVTVEAAAPVTVATGVEQVETIGDSLVGGGGDGGGGGLSPGVATAIAIVLVLGIGISAALRWQMRRMKPPPPPRFTPSGTDVTSSTIKVPKVEEIEVSVKN